MVEVRRVVDAGRPQGRRAAGPATENRRSSRRGRNRAMCRASGGGPQGIVHAQITMRSISSTVTVSAVRW